MPPRFDVYRAAKAGGCFVAVGAGGSILVSLNPDSREWRWADSPTAADLSGIDVALRHWVAVGDGVILYSRGGEEWSVVFEEAGIALRDVEFASSTAVCVALGPWGDLLTSGDGLNWSEPGSGCSSVACQDLFADVCQTDRGLVAAGGVGLCDETKRIGGGTVARCGDGQTWGVEPVALDRIRGLARGEAGFVAVGDAWAASSADGLTWQTSEVPTVRPLKSVAWCDGHYVAVGEMGTIVTSADGEIWKDQWSNPIMDLERIAWGGDRWIAEGTQRTILRGSDMHHWQRGLVSSTAHLRGAAVGDGSSVAVGDDGTILASTDQSSWYAPLSGVAGDLRDVTWFDGTLAAVDADRVGDRGLALALASPDGVHWTTFPVQGPLLRSVTSDGAGGFVAAGEDRALLHASCLGSLAVLEPQRLVARLGSAAQLTVSPATPPDTDVDLR